MKRPQSDVAILIPAFNEAGTLRGIVERALAVCPWVIVVDDGSTDDTRATLAGLPIDLLVNGTNSGKSASLWRGLVHAFDDGAAHVVTLDADGQHCPEDMPRLLEIARRNPRSFVIGSRLHDKAKIPFVRYCGNKWGSFVISWACGYVIPDCQSGFRVYPAAVMEAFGWSGPRGERFVFESEVLIRAAEHGVRSIPEPIGAIYTPGARKSHYRLVVDTARIFRLVVGGLIRRRGNLPGLMRCLRGEQPRDAHSSASTLVGDS